MDTVLQIFRKLCTVPHPTFYQIPMKNLIISILEENKISYVTDEAHNIVGYIPATKNCMQSKTLCLQAHYDMVFVSDNNQDSKTAQIITRIEGEYIKATHTSLGADNCAGLASILSLFISKLDGQELNCIPFEHGPIELLFTADEEIGLTGAKNLTIPLKSSAMINTDCEDFHNIIVGSAGGDMKRYTKILQLNQIPDDYCKLKIIYSDFKGGHTGFDLCKNRVNLGKLIFRTLYLLDCFILNLDIGQQINAMPFKADVEIAVKKQDLQAAQEIIKNTYQLFTQFVNDKGSICVITEKLDITQGILYESIKELGICEQEALMMYQEYDVPCLSTFLTIVQLSGSNLSFSLFSRSNSNLGIQFMQQTLGKLFNSYKLEMQQDHMCWEPKQSSLLETVKKVYKEYKVTIVHACYETSYLVRNTDLEAVSIGPEIHNPHSVNEELHIEKFILFTQDLKNVVEMFAK
ncbi:Aminoacyl-histidine_dipeptidase [Hexamita inflata]|uniref:Aminoacyl-histidine dipeptidase n=1 Tax=Hexamita inflata TaxID=28002 RepID=A0AA86TV54_9EUKA|nr:Aminoacyl-histidine dipeptidase [Hexamita inflata]